MPSAATETPTLYARRGYGYDTRTQQFTRPLTFLSWDAADKDSCGYQEGWFAEGAEVFHSSKAHGLVHVYSPSWRCSEPKAFVKAEAA